MADNYTQFSFELDKLTQEDASWLRKLLALEFEDDEQRKKIEETLGVPKVIRADLEYWPDFSFRLSVAEDNRPENALWLYTQDSGNPYNAALLVRAFLAEFRPGEIKQFSAAYTCSEPRLDECGGETYVVTGQNIYSDAGVANTIAKAIETGREQKMALAGLDIIVVPKNVGRTVR
jgi:hypothetical protein